MRPPPASPSPVRRRKTSSSVGRARATDDDADPRRRDRGEDLAAGPVRVRDGDGEQPVLDADAGDPGSRAGSRRARPSAARLAGLGLDPVHRAARTGRGARRAGPRRRAGRGRGSRPGRRSARRRRGRGSRTAPWSSPRSAAMRSSTSRRPSGSRALTGSSRIDHGRADGRARPAIPSRWRMPPE